MGIGIQGLNLTMSLWKDGWFEGFNRVIELGSQDLHVSQEEMRFVGEEFLKINHPAEKEYTPEVFYKGLGFKEYNCIDMDGRNNAFKFNLNANLELEYNFTGNYDLVTNYGTSEHCFDQHQVFRNIHNLCAPGGIIIHALPFQGFVNHGFFNYQPDFFRDIAAANNYCIIGMYINIHANAGDLCTYSDELMKHLYLPPNTTTALYIVMQKSEEKEFCIPYDWKYFGRKATTEKYPYYKVIPRMFIPEPFQIIDFVPTVSLAKLLGRRIVNKIAFWR